MIALSRFFAFARVELGMTPKEIDQLADYEIDHHIDAWKEKQKRTNSIAAEMMAQISNCIIASAGGKARFKATDFMAGEKTNNQQTDEQIEAACRLIFA